MSSDSSARTATFFAENLFDEYAVVSSAGVPEDIRAAGGFAPRTDSCYVLPPRTVGLPSDTRPDGAAALPGRGRAGARMGAARAC